MTDNMIDNDDLGGVVSKGGGDFSPIEIGVHDFVVTGIIALGIQEQRPFEGKQSTPVGEVRFILEIPKQLRSDGLTHTLHQDFTLKANEKSNIVKFINTLLDDELSVEQMALIIKANPETGLPSLLGKVGSLKTAEWVSKSDPSKHGIGIKRDSFSRMDKRLQAVDPVIATRETYFFNPFKPDLAVWKKDVSYWTKKKIMDAVSADRYPPELHAEWAQDCENQLKKDAEKKAGKSAAPADAPAGSISAIE